MFSLKTCTKCKISKGLSEFRLKTKNPKKYIARCKDCLNKVSIEYHNKVKDNPEFKRKASERDKVYQKTKQPWRIKKKRRESDPDYNEKYNQSYKLWYNNTRIVDPVKLQIAAKKYRTKIVENITDGYIINILKIQFPQMSRHDIRQNEELMDLKKTEILTYRLKRATKTIDNGTK